MKNALNKIFSMPLMALALLVFFVSIGYATFIENDYGTPVAQKLIFRARWFELVILYLFLTMLHNIWRYKMIQWKKIGQLTFHVAFLIIVLGAAFTRYLGFEGVMTIREGQASNEIISSETYLQYKIHDSVDEYNQEIQLILEEETNNYFSDSYLFPGQKEKSKIEFVSLMDNIKDTLIPTSMKDGDPYIEIVTSGQSGREYNYLKAGTVLNRGPFQIAFNNDEFTDAIRIFETDTGICVQSPFDFNYFQMADQTEGIVYRDSVQIFHTKRLYSVGQHTFVFNAYYPAAQLAVTSNKEETDSKVKGVTVKVSQGDLSTEVLLKGGKGMHPAKTLVTLGDLYYELSFGSKVVALPFSIALRDFQLERYPGTANPSSFASEVTIIDFENDVNEDKRIYMNNVMDYRGYRFFQSSYDQDEGGTILSVNQDRLGTITTYIGYTLLGLGFIINLMSRGSRFKMLLRKAKEARLKREGLDVILLLIGLSIGGTVFGQSGEIQVIDKDHADKFSRLVVQDFKGRMEPVHTEALEFLKKISRQTTYKGMNPTQVYLGIHTNAVNWQVEPLIYVSGQDLRDKFNFTDKRACLADFFSMEYDTYLLAEDAEIARRKKPAEQSQYDKDVLKTDERVNLLFGLFTGLYLKIMPLPNDSTNTWYSPFDPEAPFVGEDKDFVNSIIPLYNSSVQRGHATGDWTLADEMVSVIDTYQRKVAPKEILPSKKKIEIEIFYNDAGIFKNAMYAYVAFGLLLLLFQFREILKDNLITRLIRKVIPAWTKIFDVISKFFMRILTWCMYLTFLVHMAGLILRWYLSGHAPWSNGYEAVVFIGWVTVLAGILFSIKNKAVLGATGILAWLMLFVAHMNALDPEMSSLVPVLKSFWLKIHVAIITGSYGFLGLAAILGFLILFLNLFLTEVNKKRVTLATKELSHISELTMTVGLFMLTIGTFLGGVWANESWGRYWGWDAKETWALASVLTYAIILHLRFIPGLKGQFVFNAVSLWGYSSIIMTFFGVNFYLSGLHSYAQGDPLPIPTWVPVTVVVMMLLTILSGVRYWWVVRRGNTPNPADVEAT